MELRTGYKQTEVGVIPEDWNADRLSAYIEIKSGESPSKFTFMNEGLPYFKVEQLNNNNKYLRDTPYFIKTDNQVRRGSLIFPKRGASILLNKIRILENDSFMDTNLMTLTPKGTVNSEFLYYALTHIELWRIADTTSIPQINNKHINPLIIALPKTKAEQEAIAEALSDADALIESLEKLVEKKRQIKQGTMQELLTGKKRLPEFSGEWIKSKFGDLGVCHRGVSYDPNVDLSESDTDASFRLLRSNNVQNGSIVYANMQYVNARRVSCIQVLKANDVLICMANGSKELVGKAARFLQNDGYVYAYGAFMGCFRPNVAINTAYVFYLFYTKDFFNHIGILLAGSSINNLTSKSIEDFVISIPSNFDEQEAIATILGDMDSELSELETKLTKARQLKQGMMQALLTGKIRLV